MGCCWDVTEERVYREKFHENIISENLLLEENKSGVYKHIEWHDKIY
jgi:hypothetical protein